MTGKSESINAHSDDWICQQYERVFRAYLDEQTILSRPQTHNILNRMERTALTNDDIGKMVQAHKDFESSGGQLGKRISDLSDTRIDGADFSYLNLSDLVMRNSEISNCTFTETNLNHANFDGTSLQNVSFEKAELSKSEFYECSFSNVRFNHANLTRAEISGSDMRDTSFSHAVLVGSDFDGCNVLGVDFSLSELKNTLFHSCDMLDDLKKLEGVQAK